jgi:hypothetical protein
MVAFHAAVLWIPKNQHTFISIMEYILLEDVRKVIENLKKYVRPVGVGEHPLLDKDGDIRQVDFDISPDRKTVRRGPGGLSFATSMKKFKKVVALKKRHAFEEVEVNIIDDTVPLPDFLRIVRDSPGHASLQVTKDVDKEKVVGALIILSRHMENIGRMKTSI